MDVSIMPMQPSVLVFIPTYNCEKQISRVLAQFDEQTQRCFSEVLVVDNASRDETLAAIKEGLGKLSIKTSLICNKKNYNLGGAHKIAFQYALDKNFDYIVVLHGDDQGDIRDLVPYLSNMYSKDYDSFLGARFDRESTLIGYSKFKTFGNLVFNVLCSLVAKRKIKDMGSGLNVYKVRYLKNHFYKTFPDDLTFNVSMLFYGVWKKSKFEFFPLTWREDDQQSHAKVLKQAFKIILFLLKYIFSRGQCFSGKGSLHFARDI